jgi:hypothetical protein
MIVDFYKTLKQEINNYFRNNTSKINLNKEEVEILKHLKRDGVISVSNFINPETCEVIRNQIDDFIKNNYSSVMLDDVKSDHRIYGLEKISTDVYDFYNSNLINNILKSHEGVDKLYGFILGARLDYVENNLGSGNGWHRDRPDSNQTKAILYLSDTNINNGPFQYVKKSHKSFKILRDILFNKFSFNQDRFSNEEASKAIKNNLLTFEAKAGTLIFTNTRGIHRGMPILNGNRYALTFYCWPHEIPDHIKTHII